MKMSEAVALYIKLRDKKAKMKAEFDEQIKPIDEKLNQIEGKLLEVFNTTGMDSCKTEFGTAYASVRRTASVADRESFMGHVRAHDEWSLIEVRACKSAIEEFRELNDGLLPPGISLREERTVNVRRTS